MSYVMPADEVEILYKQLLEEVREIEKWKEDAKHPYPLKPWMPKKVKKALKDLDQNHNHSMAVELFLRNLKNIDREVIRYRGNSLSVEELFARAYAFSKSLKAMGYKKGDTVPVCISNIPEFAVIYLACSFIGATINTLGPEFNHDYLVEIMNKTNSPHIFVSDDYYGFIESAVEDSNIRNVVMFSLEDSLVKGNLFQKYDSRFGHNFSNRVAYYRNKENLLEIISQQEFIYLGREYKGKVLERVDLDDPLIESYSSGTTAPGKPKGVIHSNRAYMTLSRFKEFDVSGYPPMSSIVSLFVLPTFTHTGPSIVLNDTLYCKNCTVAMEPFYEPEWFPYSVLLNEAGFVPAVNSFWHVLCNKFDFDPEWKDIKLRNLGIPTVVGEGTNQGELRRYNRIAKERRFGLNKFHFPVVFSNGGGNVEGLGGYFTLFTAYLEKLYAPVLKGEPIGLTPYKCMDIKILDDDGNECGLGEPGMIYQKSPFDMISYSDPTLNETIVNKDGYLGVTLGYYSDTKGRIRFSGRPKDFVRLPDGEKYYLYQAEDAICDDPDNIYKYAIVKQVDSDDYICHLMIQPDSMLSSDEVLRGCVERSVATLPEAISSSLYFKVHSFDDYFPFTRDCGKMSRSELSLEKVDESMISYNEILEGVKSQQPKGRSYTKKRDN